METNKLIESVQTLKSENDELKEKIVELETKIFEMDMETWKNEHSYSFDSIVMSEELKETHHIIGTDSYSTKKLVEMVEKHGYEKVNHWFVTKMIEREEKAKKGENIE